MSALRWGILGAGYMAFDFVQALRTLPAGEHEVVAVGSRSLERCTEFCKDLAIPKSYGSYEELCADHEVDVIYVATKDAKHVNDIELALKYNKPILSEKPLCLNLSEVRRVTTAAKENKVLLMEALWTRFMPSWQEVLTVIKEGKIGEVRAVIGSFGKQSSKRKRPRQLTSLLLDIGIYLLNATDMVFGGEEPLSITACGHKFDSGPLAGREKIVGITMLYSNNRIAHLVTGDVGANLPNDFKVIGTKGTITVKPPFWAPEEVETPDGLKRYPLPPTDKPTNFLSSAGLRYEIAAFGEYVKNKRVESDVMPHATTERIMGWMDKIRQQMDCPLS